MKIILSLASIFIALPAFSQSQGFNLPGMSLNFGQGADLVDTLQLLSIFTIITLAPAILVLCTCFTRIIVIMAFIRQAIGTQNMQKLIMMRFLIVNLLQKSKIIFLKLHH